MASATRSRTASGTRSRTASAPTQTTRRNRPEYHRKKHFTQAQLKEAISHVRRGNTYQSWMELASKKHGLNTYALELVRQKVREELN